MTLSARFPYAGPCVDQLAYLVRNAVFRSSPTSSHPWELKVNASSVDAFADPTDRQACIELGAAIYRLKLAMKCFLLEPDIELSPNPTSAQWRARIWAVGAASPTCCDINEFAALSRCRRGNGNPRPVNPELLRELCLAAQEEGAVLVHVDYGPPRQVLAEHLAEARRRAAASGRGFERLIRKVQLRREDVVAGDVAWEHAPAVMMLATRRDDAESRVAAGCAAQRVTLMAAHRGLSPVGAGQTLSHEDLRESLRAKSRLGLYPQEIFRLVEG